MEGAEGGNETETEESVWRQKEREGEREGERKSSERRKYRNRNTPSILGATIKGNV